MSPYNEGDTTELAMMKATHTLTHRGEDDNKVHDRAQWILDSVATRTVGKVQDLKLRYYDKTQ